MLKEEKKKRRADKDRGALWRKGRGLGRGGGEEGGRELREEA